jgi:hypothetical protein
MSAASDVPLFCLNSELASLLMYSFSCGPRHTISADSRAQSRRWVQCEVTWLGPGQLRPARTMRRYRLSTLCAVIGSPDGGGSWWAGGSGGGNRVDESLSKLSNSDSACCVPGCIARLSLPWWHSKVRQVIFIPSSFHFQPNVSQGGDTLLSGSRTLEDTSTSSTTTLCAHAHPSSSHPSGADLRA